MTRLRHAWLAIGLAAALCAATLAQAQIFTPVYLFNGSTGGGAPDVAVVASEINASGTNATSYDITAPAGSYTNLICVFAFRMNANGTTISDLLDTSNVSLGATFGAAGMNGSQRVEIWAMAAVPTIRVSASALLLNLGWYCYGVTGLQSTTITASSTTTDNTDVFDVSGDVAAGGIRVAGLMDAVTDHTYTPVGFTSSINQSHETSFSSIGGYFTTAAAETPHTMSLDVNISNFPTALAVSYR